MSAIERLPPPSDTVLRFTTAGSVDDGKSTLIGRLLHDCQALLEDQVAQASRATLRRGAEGIDFSLFTDGLEAEREQGITIDVAYRYFATPRRTFIIADTPGHEQYTRNMVTGASTADLAVILADARHGVLTQTRRHAALAALLGIPRVVLAVNKMDLAEWSEAAFRQVRDDFAAVAARVGLQDVVAIPMSAILGENLTWHSTAHMPWYRGPTLLQVLESAPPAWHRPQAPFRFPVQGVVRPGQSRDLRSYTGRIESGTVRAGNEVTVLPSGLTARVQSIETFDGALPAAEAPLSVTLTLDRHLDVSRGDVIAAGAPPRLAREIDAMVCWMGEAPLDPRGRYWLRHGTRTVRAAVADVDYRLHVDTLEHRDARDGLAKNDIGRLRLRLQQPLPVDAYREVRATGSFVLIDESGNDTVAAGMVTFDPPAS